MRHNTHKQAEKCCYSLKAASITGGRAQGDRYPGLSKTARLMGSLSDLTTLYYTEALMMFCSGLYVLGAMQLTELESCRTISGFRWNNYTAWGLQIVCVCSHNATAEWEGEINTHLLYTGPTQGHPLTTTCALRHTYICTLTHKHAHAQKHFKNKKLRMIGHSSTHL